MKGKLIVIDGADGSGKGTQFKLLLKRLQEENIDVQTKDFPQYGKKSAGLVEEYLNGAYGDAKAVGPYRASVFFAVDRYDASFEMTEWLKQGAIVLCNRYVTANMMHQGGKIERDSERTKYFEWLKELEFGLFEIPEPDINLFLHVPPTIATKLVEKKGHRDYIGGEGKDLHEADMDHQRDTEKTLLELADMLPNTHLIKCAPDNEMLSPEEIHEMIWEIVSKELGKTSTRSKGKSKAKAKGKMVF
jgi:dTMP kinase